MPLALSQKCGGHPSLTLPAHETRLVVSQTAIEVGSQPFDGQFYDKASNVLLQVSSSFHAARVPFVSLQRFAQGWPLVYGPCNLRLYDPDAYKPLQYMGPAADTSIGSMSRYSQSSNCLPVFKLNRFLKFCSAIAIAKVRLNSSGFSLMTLVLR